MVDINMNLKVPALEKLGEYMASGLGAVAGPMLARWRARAEADARRIEAQGKADARRIEAESHASSLQLITDVQKEVGKYLTADQSSFHGEINLKQEIESRIEFQEEKRQRNIGSVVQMAAGELGNKEVPDQVVDPDWTARFFSDVQDVTTEQMQKIWAKILAGEVETPGRTSLRTLSILKNMTQRDAEMFKNIALFVIGGFVLHHDRYTEKVPGFPDDTIFLQFASYGLISVVPGLSKILDMRAKEHYTIKEAGNPLVFGILRHPSKKPVEFKLPIHGFTPQGMELCNIINQEISMDYLHALAQFLHDQNCIFVRGHAEGPEQKIDPTSCKIIEPRIPK